MQKKISVYKIILAITFSVGFLFAEAQIPKGANVIKIKDASFKEIATALLDAGYSFYKIDSNYQTLRTELKYIKDYLIQIRLEVRVKDSTAFLKGAWESPASSGLLMIENQKWKSAQITFGEMNRFALSFNKPVEYTTE